VIGDNQNSRPEKMLDAGHAVQEIARNGVDVQLHAHRHRTPEDEVLFREEIQENRSRIRELTATEPIQFCYPSGVYSPAFLPWLRTERVVSALPATQASLRGRVRAYWCRVHRPSESCPLLRGALTQAFNFRLLQD
jgi:peptidoglycan/xylan/chitin deacetylase (PgdA/CDA1 family)